MLSQVQSYSSFKINEQPLQQRISIYGSTDVLSSGINMSLFSAYNRGGFFDDSKSLEIVEKSNARNTFDYNRKFGTEVFLNPFKFNQPEWLFSIHLFDRSITGGNLTKDALGIFLRGNEQFLGKTAIMTNSYIRSINFQEYGLGVTKEFQSEKYSIVFHARINYLNVKSGTNFNLNNAAITFDSLGRSLTSNINGSFYTFPVNGSGSFIVNKGNGISGGLNFTLQKKNKWQIETGVFDIGKGFVYQAAKYNIDTNFSFSGIHVDIYKSIHEPGYEPNIDSITNLIRFREFSRQTFQLPFFCYFNFSKYLKDKKYTFTSSIYYRYQFLVYPSISIGLIKNETNFNYGIEVLNFGLNRIAYNIKAAYQLKNRIQIAANLLSPHYLITGNGNAFGASVSANILIN